MRKVQAILLVLFISSLGFSCSFKSKLAPRPKNIPSWTVILYMSIDNIQFGTFPTDLWGNTEKILLSLGEKSGSPVPIILLYDGTKVGDSRIIAVHLGKVIDDQGQIIPASKEVNYGDPETMAKFIIWTARQFPARNYLLGLAHHYGWKGFNTDESSPGPLKMDILTLPEYEKAMEWTRAAGVPINIIWFEACSITMMETLYQYAQDAEYVVGNEDTIDFYEEFTRPVRVIKAVSKNPDLSPKELATLLVEKTPVLTPSLLSNQFTPYNFALNPKAPGTKPELSRLSDLWQPTQFAFSYFGVMEVKLALDQMAIYLIEHLDQFRPQIEKARSQAKEYTLYPWFIDLWDFADLLENSSDDQMLKILCNNLKEKIDWSIVVQKKPKSAKHYHGILIMFPVNRKEFERETYNEFAPEVSYFDLRFSREGKWADFLKAYFER